MPYKKPFKSIFIPAGLLAVFMSGLGVSGAANAAGGNNECPVGVLDGAPSTDPAMVLNAEFGPNSQELTRCLERRHNVKVVMQINKYCSNDQTNAACTKPYALGNIRNMIKDYENTYGMKRYKDYEIVAVVHSGGGALMLKNSGLDGNGNGVGPDAVPPTPGRNKYETDVKDLIADGVKFYFCQNTTRGMIRKNILPAATETTGGATAELIPGVHYTTAGVTAISEFQSLGYRYVQP